MRKLLPILAAAALTLGAVAAAPHPAAAQAVTVQWGYDGGHYYAPLPPPPPPAPYWARPHHWRYGPPPWAYAPPPPPRPYWWR